MPSSSSSRRRRRGGRRVVVVVVVDPEYLSWDYTDTPKRTRFMNQGFATRLAGASFCFCLSGSRCRCEESPQVFGVWLTF